MKYVKIENKIRFTPSVELLATLGTSTSRGSDTKIGQFGSGFPASLALLAREDCRDPRNPSSYSLVSLLSLSKLCLGSDSFSFGTKSKDVVDSSGYESTIKKLFMKRQGGGTYDLNIDAAFGEIDWTCVTMAVREFVSNACDGADAYDGTLGSVKVEIVSEVECRAKAGTIRVFIPVTEEIDEYVSNILNYFICLRPTYDKEKVVMPATGPASKIYRRGVLVGEFGERALFNYNFDNIELNESRIVLESAAKEACEAGLKDHGTKDQVARFLTEAVLCKDDPKNEGLWEAKFSQYHFDMSYVYGKKGEQVKETWTVAAAEVVADRVVCSGDFDLGAVTSRGHSGLVVEGYWRNNLVTLGAKTPEKVLNVHDMNGRTLTTPGANVTRVFDRVWGFLEAEGLTLGKDKPKLMCFVQATLSEGARAGYYSPSEKLVCVRKDYEDDKGWNLHNIILEEIAHHCTGAKDCTRDFQEYAFKLAGLLLSRAAS